MENVTLTNKDIIINYNTMKDIILNDGMLLIKMVRVTNDDKIRNAISADTTLKVDKLTTEIVKVGANTSFGNAIGKQPIFRYPMDVLQSNNMLVTVECNNAENSMWSAAKRLSAKKGEIVMINQVVNNEQQEYVDYYITDASNIVGAM